MATVEQSIILQKPLMTARLSMNLSKSKEFLKAGMSKEEDQGKQELLSVGQGLLQLRIKRKGIEKTKLVECQTHMGRRRS